MWTPQTANGWFPRFSPDGLKLSYGSGACFVADFRMSPPREIEFQVPEGRAWHGYWLSDALFTFFVETPQNDWIRYEAMVPAHPFDVWHLTRRERLTAAFFDARDGHWAASMPWGGYLYDGVDYSPADKGHGVKVAGDYLVQLASDGLSLRCHNVPRNVSWVAQALGGDFTVNAQGWVGNGYSGPAYVFMPNGVRVDVTATPWRIESTPFVVMANDEPWVWNGSVDPETGEAFAIGRVARLEGYWNVPVKIVSDIGTASFDVAYLPETQEFALAGTDAKGRLVVRLTPRAEGFANLRPKYPKQTSKLAFGSFFAFSNPVGSGLAHPYGSDSTYPQNVTVVVDHEVIKDAAARVPVIVPVTADMLIELKRHNLAQRVWALYIASEEFGGGAVVAEAKAKEAKGAWRLYFPDVPVPPVLWYITPREADQPDWMLPPSVDIFGPQFYFEDPRANQDRMTELLWRMAGKWMDKLGTSKPWIPICQAFDRSYPQWIDMSALAAMQPKFMEQFTTIDVRIGKLLPVLGLLFFSVMRPGGSKDYPKLEAWHRAMFRALPEGLPVFRPEFRDVKPRATIANYAPISGTAPLRVRAVAEREVGSGPITQWEWWWRKAGQATWNIAVTNPVEDPDHTFTFSGAGQYEISLSAIGPGGTSQTARQRLITVEEEKPPMPQPQPQPETKYGGIRTLNDFYWCAEANGQQPINATRTQRDDWESFEFVPTGEPNKIGIRSKVTGKFLAVEPGGVKILCNRPDSVKLGAWETWEIVPSEHGGVALRAHTGKLVNAVFGGGGPVSVDKTEVGPDETFLLEGFGLGAPTGEGVQGRLRVEGRQFVNDGGIFRPRFVSALSILRRSDDERHAFLDWAAQTGFNGVRVFAGALTWAGQTAEMALQKLHHLVADAQERGLYVEITALTDTGKEGYSITSHVEKCGLVAGVFPNTLLELANEPTHPTQLPSVHEPGTLIALRGRVPPEVLVALGSAPDDESTDFGGGDYITVHLDRGRDKWNQIRRVREMENLSATLRKPVVNNEPIGADERDGSVTGKQRFNDPAVFFGLGALNRLFEIGGVFHSQNGLDAVLPGPVQQQCADAFIRGSLAIKTQQALQFKNTGWADSPIASANFERTIVRVYSGLSDEQSAVVLVGLSGDPGLRLQNGWRLGNVLDEMPGVQVVELIR